jgi:F0F1-type ATP synthase assembly protein I
MKKIIWMEIALIGASILIFRSVWNLLDKSAWASSEAGLIVLLVVGIVAAVITLRGIEALAGKTGKNGKES